MIELDQMINNVEIARLLRKMAAAYTILGENRFKIVAYENAATAAEHATSELQDLWEQGKLDNVSGFGPSISEHLTEIFKTGKSKHFDEVLGKVPPAVFPLLEVPGLGPKKAEKLVKLLKIKREDNAIGELEKAAKLHKIAEIASFGAKSEQVILDNIERYKKGAIKEKRMTLPAADLIADELIAYLKKEAGAKIQRLDKLGSLRRQVATVGDLDMAVATNTPEEVIKIFCDYPLNRETVEMGPTGATILLSSGRTVDLRVSDLESYGAMLQYFTGSKYHNIKLREFGLKKGYSLSEYGIKKLKTSNILKFNTEEKFYNFLGLDYIPPEIREDAGEIDAALKHELPNLIKLSDIKGDLHLHSNLGQNVSHDAGVNSVEEIQKVANDLGYEYFAVTDHNPSLVKHNFDQIIAEMKRRKAHIEEINKRTKSVRVVNMLEVDINPEGELVVPQDGLDFLDACLVSVHSSFTMTKEAMTKRILSGLSSPTARILAHPTGRLLGQRDSYDVDWDQIFRFCLEHDKALEINAYPNRLDLPDTLVRDAVNRGVKLSLGSDAHVKEDLALMRYGVSVARRGWAQKKNLVNTLNYADLSAWLKKRS